MSRLFRFQSTRPARGATEVSTERRACRRISIHAPRAGRDYGKAYGAFYAGRDTKMGHTYTPKQTISIHAPRAGRDHGKMPILMRYIDFNPRAPRGARPAQACRRGRASSISIHAPRAGRDSCIDDLTDYVVISIHAPRAGRDLRRQLILLPCFHFNPRAPRGARRLAEPKADIAPYISIHAPRRWHSSWQKDFNPRAPRGARPSPFSRLYLSSGFQSTRPARGATSFQRFRRCRRPISIHAPRAGRDPSLPRCP